MEFKSLFEQWTTHLSFSTVTVITSAFLGLILVYILVYRWFTAPVKSATRVMEKPFDKTKEPKESRSEKSNEENKTAPLKKKKKKNGKSKDDNSPLILNGSSLSKQSGKQPETNAIESSEKAKANNDARTSSVIVPKSTTNPSNAKADAILVDTKKKSNKVESKAKMSRVDLNPTKPLNDQCQRQGTSPISDIEKNTNIDREDDGSWLTQGHRQTNTRQRPKVKTDSPGSGPMSMDPPINEPTPSSPMDPPMSMATAETESFTEPIEMVQLIPRHGDPYSNDDRWWKQPFGKKGTFSISDIGHWPEYEQHSEYIIRVHQIYPANKTS